MEVSVSQTKTVPLSPVRVLSQPAILGFDPGRQKCGLAIMGLDRVLRHQEVVQAESALDAIQALRQQYPISIIVMGNQTTAKTWKAKIADLPDTPRVMLVDERYSTLEARDRYWQMYPPKGVGRLLPQSLRKIPRPIDDIVAILLIERYLNRLTAN
ncbi:MAG: Holliday junction resolvase RuvX [Cyanobacteria bacterium Co-bin13]|nr:Holliday junction resolvase RuvX [Cyanobacteria bacterium Co-bin13]